MFDALSKTKLRKAIIGTPVHEVTSGQLPHFYGSRHLCPWDRTQTLILAMECELDARLPGPLDVATYIL